MTASSGKSLLQRFDEIIEKNINNPAFSIDEACRDLGTSRSQLFRAIKAETNLSTSLYIRRRKLEKAKELLRTSDMKTSEIAYSVGIDSPQNFSKYFSQEFGVTPTAFRNRKEDNVEEVVLSNAQPKSKKKLYIIAGAAIGIIISAVTIYFLAYRTEKLPKNEFGFVGNSIAIIPFKNLGSPQTAFYCDGIAEQIHGSLSLNEQLKVVSTTSSDRYKNSSKSLNEIAKELDVNYILEGSVFQDKGNIRINVGLVRVQDDRRIWTNSYEGSDDEVFSYITKVSTKVADELGQKLSAEANKRIAKAPTSSPAAYKEYLQGIQLITSRTKERLEEGVSRFSNAIEFDPDFADAYANLGLTYYLQGVAAFIDEPLSFKLAEENSLKAIRLDTENSLAYANLANIYYAQHKWEQSKTSFDIALQLDPNNAMVNYWYSLLLKTTGDPKAASRYSSKAVELDPLHPVIYGGNISNLTYAGELEKAREYIDNGKLLFNDSWVYYWHVAIYNESVNNMELALQNITRATELAPDIRIIKRYKAYCQGRLGQTEKVEAFLKSLPDTPDYDVARSVAYSGMGDQQKSMEYLEKAAAAGHLMHDILVDPVNKIHRKDPRFDAVLEKYGLHQ